MADANAEVAAVPVVPEKDDPLEKDKKVIHEEDNRVDENKVDKKVEDKIPKITLSQFFDIIGQINIILQAESSLRFGKSVYPFEGVSAGELKLSKVEELPVMFEVFVAGDDKVPWILTRFPQIDDFKTFDEYISNVWKCILHLLECACVVLVCPSSSYWANRIPNPAKLGYPTDKILKVNAMVHDYIDLIVRNINYRDRTPTLVDATVCGDRAILQVSNNLVLYGEEIMPGIRDIIQLSLNLSSSNVRSGISLPYNSVSTHFNPIFDFRYSGYIFYNLPYYVRLGYDMTVHAIAPQIPIDPINDSVIIKQSQTSVTRSGFLQDIIAVQHNPGMSSDFAILISTLLVPGYIQVDIDWSDVPSEASELVGFIALLSKAIFMRSYQTLDSITDESARRVETRIVDLGVKNQLFRRIDEIDPNAYPLRNVEVTRYLNINFLNGLRTDLTGRGWMNSNRDVRMDDGFGQIYRTQMERRPVYAVTCSSYERYLDDENDFRHQWDIYRAIEGFVLAWSKRNNTLSECMLVYLDNLLRFYVRMNEYLRYNFHTGLRLPENLVNRLIGDEKERSCLRVSIKSKSILAFAKSLGVKEQYVRRISYLHQIQVESKIVEDMSMMRAMFNVIRGETIRYGVNPEYGKQKIWSTCISVLNQDGSPYASHLYNLQERKLLSNLPRNYVIEVEDSDLYMRIFPIFIDDMNVSTIQKGWLRSFFYKSTNFRINTVQELLDLARTGNIEINRVEDFQAAPYDRINVPNQIRPWLRACSPSYNLDVISTDRFLEILLPLKINIDIDKPFFVQQLPLTFTFPDTDRKILSCVHFKSYTFGVLKILTNEVRVPDHIVHLAVSPQCVAALSADIDDVIMRLENFVAKIGSFTQRVTLLRDSGAEFSSVFVPLPI